MVILARFAAHGLGGVLGPHGIDAAVLHSVFHEIHQVRPRGVKGFTGNVPARQERGEAVAKEGLGPVDIAHAGIKVLIHHEGADAAARFMHFGPECLHIGVRAQRVLAYLG